MPGNRHMLAEREIIVLPLLLSHVVDDQRHALPIAPVGDDADMPVVFEDDDIALLPVIAVDVRAQVHTVGGEKDVKHAGTTEIDIRVRLGNHTRVSLRTGGDVGVDHGFEIVPGVGEGTPDDISAGATVGRRIPALGNSRYRT